MMDAAKAIDALHSIPPDLPRDEWVKVGMGAQAAGVSFDDFDAWSAGAANYDARACRDTWRSFKPGKGVGPGTLYRIAAEHGWRMGDKPLHRPMQAPRKAAEPPRKPAPGMSPAEVWSRCEAATAEHGYIVAKGAAGVPLDDLRVVPAGDPLRIQGESMAGALVVPAHGPEGLQSLLLIPPPGAGKKLNLPGAPMAGASFTVGDVVAGAPLYLCEGIGTAWACWQATGHPAVVAFGWGSVSKVAEELRQRYASARLVLVPDVGKEAEAAEIAKALQCAVAYMPQGEEQNFDANDLAQRDGHDVLAALLEAATEPPKPAPHLMPVSVADVITNPAPPPEYVWEGYLPRGVVSMMGAHGGTGKSTIALMLAVAATLGRPVFGVATVACKTLFVSLEDGAPVVRWRLALICRHWGIEPASLEGRLHIVDGTENPELFACDGGRASGMVTPTYSELKLLVQRDGIGMVVVDNASDAFGGDEIQRRQVRAFIRALALVARLNHSAVLLLAHVDKGTSRNRKPEGGEGYSGSTAWHNSVRSRLFMSRAESGLLTLEHQKTNFGKQREPLTLEWPEDGFPQVVSYDPSSNPFVQGLMDRAAGRADDESAAAVLRMLAEFEERGQYASPKQTARNNVHAMLRPEPAFQKLKLNKDATARIINQCQRAKWIEMLEYKTPDRKLQTRWTLTPEGRTFAGLPAPTAPTAPTSEESAESAESARGAPTAPTS